MNLLRNLNNTLRKFFYPNSRGNRVKTAAENSINCYHNEIDPKHNIKTTPPQEEKIRIPALWAFEVYTPSHIANFHDGLDRLGWSQDARNVNNNFQDTLNELRHRTSGSGWINLGRIVDETKNTWWPGVKKAKLPEGIEVIEASILQFLPSTTILACNFIFNDDMASSIENPLRDTYSTYQEKTDTGFRIIDVLHQKKDAVVLAREFLKNLCTSWLTDNFPGLFSSGYIDGNFPVCEFITFDSHVPYQGTDEKSHDNFLSMLDLDRDFNVWKSDELKGLFLQFSEGENKQISNMMLFGNVNDMLSDKDLKCYVDNVKDQIINYLSYIDNSLGIWVLFVLAKAFERRIAILRDSYGAYDVDNLTDNTKILMNLDRQVLDLQKDAVPFIHELKSCCEHKKCFMHDVFEFRAVHEMRKSDNGFFNSIRKRLLFYADSLNDNEKLLRSTAEANRQIASAKSSNFLAQTNIGLQKRMNWMTFIILILTIVSAISAIFEIKKTFVLKSISEWFVGFIKIIT